MIGIGIFVALKLWHFTPIDFGRYQTTWVNCIIRLDEFNDDLKSIKLML